MMCSVWCVWCVLCGCVVSGVCVMCMNLCVVKDTLVCVLMYVSMCLHGYMYNTSNTYFVAPQRFDCNRNLRMYHKTAK